MPRVDGKGVPRVHGLEKMVAKSPWFKGSGLCSMYTETSAESPLDAQNPPDPDITISEEDDEEDKEESVTEPAPSPDTNQRITRSKTNNLPPPIDRFASST